mmetsp:Transcript_104212/g.270024  ORF Transcript_104212/g.270024 Transcript_104212/m.270024 type:complete len:221 (-) Transcript_104212:80-742(-)
MSVDQLGLPPSATAICQDVGPSFETFSISVFSVSGEVRDIADLQKSTLLSDLCERIRIAFGMRGHHLAQLVDGTRQISSKYAFALNPTLADVKIDNVERLTVIWQKLSDFPPPMAGNFRRIQRFDKGGYLDATARFHRDGAVRIFVKMSEGKTKIPQNEGLLGLQARVVVDLRDQVMLRIWNENDDDVRTATLSGPAGRRELFVGQWFPLVGETTLREER